METVDKLTLTLDLTEFASRIIHPLVRTLDSVPELQSTAMDTLCAMVMQMGPKFTIFIPMVQRVIQKHKIAHQRYFILMARILKVSHRSQMNFKKTFTGKFCLIRQIFTLE